MDRVSIVACINDMMRDLFKRPKFEDENFKCIGIVPWSGETVNIENDKNFIDFLEMHLAKDVKKVKLDIQVVPFLGRKLFTILNTSSQAHQDPESSRDEVFISKFTQAVVTHQPQTSYHTPPLTRSWDLPKNIDEDILPHISRLFEQYENNREEGSEFRVNPSVRDDDDFNFKVAYHSAFPIDDATTCDVSPSADDATIDKNGLNNTTTSKADDIFEEMKSIDTIEWTDDDIRDIVKSESISDADLDLTDSRDGTDDDRLSDYSSGGDEYAAVDDDQPMKEMCLREWLVQ